MSRVVITGLGVVSPVGNGQESFWAGLCAGRSGIGPITLFDVSSFPVRIGGQVYLGDMQRRAAQIPELGQERDRKVQLGLVAAEEALANACVTTQALERASLHVGVSLEVFFLQDLTGAAHSPNMQILARNALAQAHSCSLQTPLDRLAERIGDRYGVFGGRWTNCSACAAGAQAIGEAFHMLREGQCEMALAGAADSMLNPLGLGGFSLLRILSMENDNPQQACRPFDASREGTVLSEGAAFVVLERLEHATARHATIYAEMLGYASSMDAFRVSDPEPAGHGAALCMAGAIRDAGLTPAGIDCISAHATGTPKNDIAETAAIQQVLGERAYQIPVHAIKSMTGHMIAASGAAEAVAAAMTICKGTIPPTTNLQTPDPLCDLDYVPGTARPFAGRTVLSNSFGFGGQNATLIFGRYDR